jgi:polysaccharide pyruvyl transferase WcaK-like protein
MIDLELDLAPADSDRSTAAPALPRARRARRILFLGTHGQANIGDELLMTTFLQQLGDEHRYAVNSYSPERTRAQLEPDYDVEVFSTAGDRRSLVRHLLRCDAVVFGGGSIVKELYRSVGRWRYSTLVMVLALVLIARLARRPVLLCGIGVGPIDTRLGRLLAGTIVRCASLVSVRDASSYDTCMAIGARAERVVRIPDPAFANRAGHLLVPGPHRCTPATGGSNARVRIALNLNRDIANGERWDDALVEIAGTLDLVAARMPIEVHSLPMQSEFKEHDDASVLREFLAGHPEWNPVLHETADHRDVARIIVDCDLVVSERFHAIVIAAILGRPTIGLLYDVKVAELADQLDIRSVDINAPFDPAFLAEAILDASARRADEELRLWLQADDFRAELDDHFDAVRRWLDDPAGCRAWPATNGETRRRR